MSIAEHARADPDARAEELAAAEILRAATRAEGDATGRTGVLLVSHGSRSPTWRRMLLDVHAEASAELLDLDGVVEVRSAFMEYTEPSIATQLRRFDAAGIESVVVVPLLLTISDHSFDDIPTICGRTADAGRIAQLGEEGIEVYEAEADLDFAPLLDFSDLIRTNLARRLRAIVGRRPDREESRRRDGLLLVGYGSAEFEDEWNRFFREVRAFAESDLEVAATAHAWCGHVVRYSRQPTTEAIEGLLDRTDRVIVVPVLVAYDQMFQQRIIGRAVNRCAQPERVLYRPDAILPEPALGRWVVEIVARMVAGAAPS
ncbi:MAG: CbiX/SirB N-terminal domain-containing protein [Solirubrobacterales bacterium]